MVDTQVLGMRPGGGTLVKNTFIEMMPSSVSPMPSPLASAPAKCASNFSLKESLAEAALDEDAPLSAPVKVGRARPRTKPDPLKCVSTNSMMSIPESPSGLSQPIVMQSSVKASRFAPESWASIPPTPAGLSDFGSTPTGTPLGVGMAMLSPRWAVPPTSSIGPSLAIAMTAPAMAPPSQAPLLPSRATLSLVDMIQSPKAATAAFQGYFPQGQPIAQAVQPSTMPPPPQYQPNVVVNSAPPTSVLAPAFSTGNVRQLAPPAAPPMGVAPSFAVGSMPAPPSFPAREIGTFQGQLRSLPEERQTLATSAPSAAVALGLLSAPSGPTTTATAVGTLAFPPTASVILPPSAPPTQFVSSAPTASMVMTQPAMATATATVTVNSQPQRMVPPPPLNPAPMAVYSPTATGPPTSAPTCMTPQSAESDMKVLLDMAVLSGNQKAVDALLRQAQLSGMSTETIRQLMPPKAEPVVMSTSPVSR